MPSLRLTVKTVTPLIMFGANNDMKKGDPELRASSIRGTLRYWLRAVLGSDNLNPSDLYKQESAILGSTDMGSKINVRVTKSKSMADEVIKLHSVLPQQITTKNGNTIEMKQAGFKANNQFIITFATHPLEGEPLLAEDSPMIRAIFAFTQLGGLGRRARRGSGNLTVMDARGYNNEALPLAFTASNQAELKDYLTMVCQFITPTTVTIGSRPSYPVFAWDTATVLIGKVVRDTYEDAYNDLWSASGPYHHEGGIFGDVRPRRSSAMHMRVIQTDEGYVPLQTILYTGNGEWGEMKRYIGDQLSNGFTDIYGTWGHWQ